METDSLLLRRFMEPDIDDVFKGLSNPRVIKYYGVRFWTLEETEEQMKWFADLEENGAGIWWAVCSKESGTFFGAGGLNNLQVEHRKAEVGFWLLPEFWGKEIIVEAMPLILDYAFNQLDLRRVEGFVETENTNCIRALEKLEFTYEGTMTDSEIKEGAFISLSVFAKFNPDSR